MTRLLLTADAVGGVWQYTTDLAAGLVPLGFEPILAVMGPSPSEAQRNTAAAAGLQLIDTGLPLDWLADDAEAVQRAGRGIAALAGDVGAELVQLHAPALAGAARFPAPVVAVAHSCVASWWAAVESEPLPVDLAWRAALVARGLAQADRVVAPSAAFAAALARTYALRTRPAVVHNGRAPLALPEAAMHDFALTVGRLWDRGKGVATLDRAAAALGVPFKAAGAVCSPDGEQITLENIIPIGTIDEARLAGLLAAKPVFVSAARYEPFGLAVLEAAQAGCALVLADIPTFRELWEGAATFVTPDDARGFAHAIEATIGDTQLRLARGAAAQARAARYSVAAMAADMGTILSGLTARRAAA